MNNKKFLEMGQIVSTHGIKGEVRVKALCNSPEILAELDDLLYFDKGNKPATIIRSRVQKNIVIMEIEGITTVEQAQALRNSILYINHDEYPLEDGEYFIDDIIGTNVVDDKSGEMYGQVTDVFQTGANDVYEIKGNKSFLIPVIPQVVVKTDLDQNEIRINMLEGLIDED